MIRFIAGDCPATTGDYGGAGILGGLNLSKNFSFQPYLTRYPGMGISGIARTPSDIEIYINDRLVRTAKLNPGEFHYRNFPILGSGEATIIIRDAFGREQIYTNPFFVSSRLLKPGLDSFSYSLGFKRELFGFNAQRYGDLAFAGFHRRGFTEQFTGGLGIEISRNLINVSTNTTLVPANWGEMNVSLTMSHKHGQSGYGGGLGVFIPGRKGINLKLSAVGYSRYYSSLFAIPGFNVKFSGIFSLGFYRRSLGSLSASYSIQERYGGYSRKSLALLFRRRIIMNGFLFLSISKVWTDIDFYEANLGLNFFLGRQKSLTLNTRFNETETRFNASFHKNPPMGIGTGYRVQIDGTRNSQINGFSHTNGLVRFDYRSAYGIHALDYRRSVGRHYLSFRTAGSISLVGRKIYLSRPINDSFVLVKVGDVQGAKIRFNNHQVGSTNRNGELLVPGLISYLSNRLTLDTDEVPLNYNILETSKYAATYYRGGGVLEFDVKKFQAFEGRIYHLKDGKKEFLEFAFMEIEGGGKTISSVSGKDGEFYLEDLSPGKYRVKISKMEEEYLLELFIPVSKEIIVDLGDLACEIN